MKLPRLVAATLGCVVTIVAPLYANQQDNPANTVSANTGSSAVINTYSGTPDLSGAVPTVIMPGLSNAPETCAISRSMSGVLSGFGVGVGSSFVDPDCNIRMYAKLMAQLGDPEAAKAILCSNPQVALAYSQTGRSCPAHIKLEEQP